MVKDEGWTQHWSIKFSLTLSEAKLLAAAIRKGQNTLADTVLEALKGAK